MIKQEIKENIKRLKNTVKQGCFADGYIKNCEREIKAYEKLQKRLLSLGYNWIRKEAKA